MSNAQPQILLCDDEVHILRAAEIKFRRAGYRIQLAADGQEAWEMIQADCPDLLITDCQMPRMSGLELVRAMRGDDRLPRIPVLMLTAKGYEIRRDAMAADLEVRAIIAKPFSPRAVLRAAEEALDRGRQCDGRVLSDDPLSAAIEGARHEV